MDLALRKVVAVSLNCVSCTFSEISSLEKEEEEEEEEEEGARQTL